MRITSTSTNLLVAKLKGYFKRFAVPAGATAVVLFAVCFLINRGGVHAASSVAAAPASSAGAAPMDDSSVSALTALDNAVEAVAARVTPAVVNIAVTSKGSGEADTDSEGNSGEEQGQRPRGQMQLPPGFEQFFGPNGPFGGQLQQGPMPPQIEHGIGSGIIISPDGYIVTNNHVVDGAVQIRVTLHDRRVLTGKVVGTDKLTDLAVIKVDGHDLPTVAWGDSSKLHAGQTVLAFGSPFGYFQFSVTRGIVSAVNRPNPYAQNARQLGGYIQTDAAINPGNSGGPLVNAHGELVGINTFIISNSGSFAGAGFAIPSQIVRATADQLIKNGSVQHGYMGIAMNDVTPDNAGFFKLKDAEGAIVSQVTPDSPASRAGLKSGDVIRELNGEKVVNGGALQVAVSELTPGTTIALGIVRDGAPQTVHVTLGQFNAKNQVAENEGGNGAKGGRIGIGIDDLTPQMRQQLGVPEDVHGAAVGSVRPGSPADDAGIVPGDVIVEINRLPVSSAQQLITEVHNSPAGKDILLLVWSKGNASYRVLHPSNG
ncbi:MAG TPA: trypsin-like peptidase domain-containing protein [Granulicella sp.]|nr:trypsin-like peptidase domain-containing protein [Granulicella sp.]